MSNKVFNLDKALIKIKLTNGNFLGIKLDKNRQIAELTPAKETRSILNTYRGRPYALCNIELAEDLNFVIQTTKNLGK